MQARGLYHVGAREYDPRTGRWLQRDPIDVASGDPNLYRYCGNDPINTGDDGGTQQRPKQPTTNNRSSERTKIILGKIPPQKPVQPKDSRWTQPKGYPGPTVVQGPNGPIIWDPNIHIELWVAAHYPTIMALIRKAYAITYKYFPEGTKGMHGGPADAFRHCVWACLVQRELGDFGYQHVVVDHENPSAVWAKGSWDDTYSPMDLANDEVGRQCAKQKNKSCEQACLEALKRGELYVLPKRYWKK